MSAIGSYAVVTRHRFPACVHLARQVHSETSGKWMFKKTETVGLGEFKQAWQAAVVNEVSFDHSGYVLVNYLDAQQAVNQIQLMDEQAEAALALCKAFTAAFPFDQPATLPELSVGPLLEYCQQEYDSDAEGMVAAIRAAHLFYQEGLNRISSENLVVFVIR